MIRAGFYITNLDGSSFYMLQTQRLHQQTSILSHSLKEYEWGLKGYHFANIFFKVDITQGHKFTTYPVEGSKECKWSSENGKGQHCCSSQRQHYSRQPSPFRRVYYLEK